MPRRRGPRLPTIEDSRLLGSQELIGTAGRARGMVQWYPIAQRAPRAGAISAFGDSEFIDCIISGCSASDGGVIEGEEIVIDGLTCWDNDCFRGAIYDPYGVYYNAITVRNSIIGETSSGIAIESNGGGVWLRCLDILDETWSLAGTWRWSDVFSEDPLFCHPEARDFGLDVNSPCAPWNGPEDCDQIGAREVECGVTPVVESSWGMVKERFRR